jgi:nicotinate-nucleotide adenylyltransferase
MRVAFFGGTFDPPHRGHVAVVRAASSEFSLDTVIFAPTARQPLKNHGASAGFADRLAMVELLCAEGQLESTRLEPSTLEAPRTDGQPNYTIDTLRHLRTQGDGAELFVITGADAFLDLRRWREPEALLEIAEWIVVSRPGFSFAGLDPMALTPQQRSRVHLLEEVHEPASASEVRERLKAGLDCSDLLTPEVLEYIQEHRLYGVRAASGNR